MQIKRGSLAITQILILLIGILAFSYMLGEIGKSQGIEISKGIGVVSAEEEECKVSSDCNPGYICAEGKCIVDSYFVGPLPDTQESASRTGKSYEVPGIYKVGDEFTIKDKEGKEQKKVIEENDLDEKGNLKEESGFVKWATGLGAGYVGGKITTGVDKLIRGGKLISSKSGEEIAKNAFNWKTANIQYAGPIIGAFLAWGFYKWILKGDVRNMRDITIIAATTGLAGTITAIAIGSTLVPGIGWIVGGAVLVVVLVAGLFTWSNYSAETFVYITTAWKAKTGGDDCDKCNDLKYGCAEYQCRSFGKGCELVNIGTTQEVCVWINPNDISAPVIGALEKILPSDDYSYQPLEPVQGVKLAYSKDQKNCIPPYTSVTLGIKTDEAAECKIDTGRTPDFNEMVAPMTGESNGKEHTLFLPHIATPSVESQTASGIPNSEITNGQAQEFYIRCEDANGNSNTAEYIMEFCVQDGPDTSAPIITGTNYLNFLQYNQTDTGLEVYTNEPAECKWSPENLDYDSMQFEMDSCSLAEGDYLFSGFKYGCKGTLTGLKDRQENKVYIKCKDKPWWSEGDQGKRYANEESHVLTLIGTEPLVLDKITVNGKTSGATIKDSTNTITAKLEATNLFGAENGKAKCEYKSGGNFVGFYNDGETGFVNINKQNLYLAEGDYNISIRCFDAGGNSDSGNIEFTLVTDREAPIAARAYYDVNNLKIITNEPAECVYTTQSNIGCAYEFKDGTAMNEIGESTHYTSWQANKKYFIKCKDAFGNQPLPGQCSIIVRAFESFE